MEFKTNRLYYVLSKKFKNKFFPFLLLILISNFVYFVTDNSDIGFPVCSAIALIAYLIFDIFSKPSKFKVYDNYVALKITIRIPKEYSNKHTTKRVNAKVLNIEEILYRASPFEQSNRVGRITFYGRVVARDFCNDYVGAEHLPSKVTVYGVKDFEAALSTLKATFPDATLTEI